jgi:hypothetical protein
MGDIGSVTGAPTVKPTENFSTTAQVLQDMGNHVHFKVRVDGIGDRMALNCSPKIIRVGDIVKVTIHNNPVQS